MYKNGNLREHVQIVLIASYLNENMKKNSKQCKLAIQIIFNHFFVKIHFRRNVMNKQLLITHLQIRRIFHHPKKYVQRLLRLKSVMPRENVKFHLIVQSLIHRFNQLLPFLRQFGSFDPDARQLLSSVTSHCLISLNV